MSTLSRRRPEAGVTLVELLLSLSIASVLVGTLSMALVLALRTVDETGNRFSEAYDAELIGTYFVPDALSATTVGQTIDTGCALQADGDVIRMQSPGVATGYRLEGTELRRWTCDGGQQRSSVVAKQLADAVAWSTGGHQVAMTLVALSGHTYTVMGTQRTGTVDLPPPPASGSLPVAVMEAECTYLVCSLTGAGSSDADGAIATYRWTFGDGATAEAPTPDVVHTYAANGSYSATLTVVDNAGHTGTTARLLVVAANLPPTAQFTASCTGRTCSVDATASSDPDGSLVAYAWSWGDGTADGSGVTASHTYASSSARTIRLTVTDDGGATATFDKAVKPNLAPTASFTVDSCNLGICAVNASGSSDPDGTIASYAWSWGDGTANGSGVSGSHTYAAVGTRTITLTVTDNEGATAVITKSVDPPVLVITTATSPSYSATLAWTNPNALAGTTVDVYRNGSVVGSNVADNGSWTRTNSSKSQVNGSYKVCERSAPTRCTNTVTVAL